MWAWLKLFLTSKRYRSKTNKPTKSNSNFDCNNKVAIVRFLLSFSFSYSSDLLSLSLQAQP